MTRIDPKIDPKNRYNVVSFLLIPSNKVLLDTEIDKNLAKNHSKMTKIT